MAVNTAATHDALPSETPELNRLISGLGFEIVDIAGFLETLHHTSDQQLRTLSSSSNGLHMLTQASDAVLASVARVSASSAQALDAVERSVETVREASDTSRSVSGWAANFGDRIADFETSLGSVNKANAEITNIAVQVNILAINAGIEAARAGDDGRGFAIIAGAIKELAQSTSNAAKAVADQINHLSTALHTLKSEAETVAVDAQTVLDQSSLTDTALGEIAGAIQLTSKDSKEMAQQAENVEQASSQFAPAFEQMSALTRQTAEGVTQASARGTALIERSEAIVQQAASLGGETEDSPFIFYVQDAADRICDMWEEAIRAGRISPADMFDTNYVPVAGSDPAQFTTRFTAFADATLPPLLEAALTFDPKVVFCAAIDRSGYLPTHNKKFSHPLSDDPVWNASNCRNRRIFDDRVGLKSGQNTQPFLLQVYRRDMGGGAFKMMKDLTAPITINGRHWGGLRMGYSFG